MRRLRKSRNGLRPCRYKGREAYFHYFSVVGDQERGLLIAAIIEYDNGSVEEVDACRIKFEDVVSDGDKIKMKNSNGVYMDFTVVGVDGNYVTGETEYGGFMTDTISGGNIFVYEEGDM